MKRAAGVDRLTGIIDKLTDYYTRTLEPGRMRTAEASALGEQEQLYGLDADYSRRGLAGSGAHLAARGGARASRQARNNQALIDMYVNALQGGIQSGHRVQELGVQALQGTQTTAFAPSFGASFGDWLSGIVQKAAAAYLSGGTSLLGDLGRGQDKGGYNTGNETVYM